MPESLTQQEIDSKTDPSVAKQYDTETPMPKQIEEFYKTVDKLSVGLLTTIRPRVGPVARSMHVAKRRGPDFLFLANNHSQKFTDIDNDSTAQITFQDSSSQNWVSVTGTVTKATHDDPLVGELYNPMISAWFGDLGDGKHKGNAEDPRMSVIEVKAKYIVYWLSTVGKAGMMKEVGLGAATGKVANTGVHREFKEDTVESMRTTQS